MPAPANTVSTSGPPVSVSVPSPVRSSVGRLASTGAAAPETSILSSPSSVANRSRVAVESWQRTWLTWLMHPVPTVGAVPPALRRNVSEREALGTLVGFPTRNTSTTSPAAALYWITVPSRSMRAADAGAAPAASSTHAARAIKMGRMPLRTRQSAESSRTATSIRSPVATQVETAGPARSLAALRDELRGLELRLATPGAEAGRRARDEVAGQIDDYLLPRLARMDAPLLMVVGGSTGAGKSTLVNSPRRARRSARPGVLRPTTRAPVLACHPADVPWFEDDRILPGLSRTTGGAAGPRGLRLSPTDRLPSGLALLDAPDIDSVVEANRALAGQLLAAADAWLFVTTAARYADAVPWDLLHAARDRGTALSVVLDRVPEEAAADVRPHLESMLAEHGLRDTPLLVVPETAARGRPAAAGALAPVRAMARRARGGRAGAGRARRGVRWPVRWRACRAARRPPSRRWREQLEAAAALREAVDSAYAGAVAEVDDAVRVAPSCAARCSLAGTTWSARAT